MLHIGSVYRFKLVLAASLVRSQSVRRPLRITSFSIQDRRKYSQFISMLAAIAISLMGLMCAIFGHSAEISGLRQMHLLQERTPLIYPLVSQRST